MFSRRSTRTNRRNIGAVVPATAGNGYPTTGSTAPLGLIQTRTALGYWHGDLDVDESDAADRVRVWGDQVGSNDFEQLTAAVQPGHGENVLNGHAVLSGNGTDRFMASALALPAPGTTPTWVLAIIRQNSHATTSRVVGGATTTQIKIGGTGTTPQMNLNNANAGPANAGAVLSSWVRLRAYFSNTTADYLRLAATNATGTALGNNAAAAIGLFGLSGGGSYGAFSIAALGFWNGEPTASEMSAVDSWVTDEFGAGVGL